MFGGLTNAQKIMGGIVVVIAIAGWVIAGVDMSGSAVLEGEVAAARANLQGAQAEVSKLSKEVATLQQRIEKGSSLKTLTAAVKTRRAELAALQAQVDVARTSRDKLHSQVAQQRQLISGAALKYITSTRSRVRAEPNTEAKEVAVVPADVPIEVFEVVKDGAWYKVGGMGYMFHKLLKPAPKQ